MAADKYIPAGRTSLVKRGDTTYQLQTEYAWRPMPRVTTTISASGRVIHKVERELNGPVESLEEQHTVEIIIRRQHAEISAVVKDKKSSVPLESVESVSTVGMTLQDRIAQVEGVSHVYRLDNEGKFHGANTSDAFKTAFGPVFENLSALLDIFMIEPGVGVCREKGVYEVHHDRLYLVSAGPECYFVVIGNPDYQIDYEAELKELANPSPFVKNKPYPSSRS